MSLNAAAITELTSESAVRAIFAEWLGLYFDGNAHPVGNAGSPVFPKCAFNFGEGIQDQPDGAAPPTGLPEIRLVIVPHSGKSIPCTDKNGSGRRERQLVLLQFWVSGKLQGRGKSQKQVMTVAELLKAILTNPATRSVLAERGVFNLKPTDPQALNGADQARFIVGCAGEIQYGISY